MLLQYGLIEPLISEGLYDCDIFKKFSLLQFICIDVIPVYWA